MTDPEIKIVEIDPHQRAAAVEKSRENIPEDQRADYIELIKTICAGVYSGGNLPPGIEFDDLVGFGYEGLVKAWRNYDQSKGAVFRTYATYRIRGEVLDNIRKEWKAKNPNYNKRVDKELIQEKILEMAKNALDDSEDKETHRDEALYSALSSSAIVYLLSLENMENISPALTKDDVGGEIIKRIERTNERIFLQEAIEELDEEERQLVRMYYYEGRSQLDISKILSMSKSKVSRLHVKILDRLKHKLAYKLNKGWSV